MVAIITRHHHLYHSGRLWRRIPIPRPRIPRTSQFLELFLGRIRFRILFHGLEHRHISHQRLPFSIPRNPKCPTIQLLYQQQFNTTILPIHLFHRTHKTTILLRMAKYYHYHHIHRRFHNWFPITHRNNSLLFPLYQQRHCSNYCTHQIQTFIQNTKRQKKKTIITT